MLDKRFLPPPGAAVLLTEGLDYGVVYKDHCHYYCEAYHFRKMDPFEVFESDNQYDAELELKMVLQRRCRRPKA